MSETERFEEWWEKHGQFCRAGGGDYEKTFAYNAWIAAKAEAEKLESSVPIAELKNTIAKVRDNLFILSGSALLSGEKCDAQDGAILYGIVCNANNALSYCETLLEPLGSTQPAPDTQALIDAAVAAALEAVIEERNHRAKKL